MARPDPSARRHRSRIAPLPKGPAGQATSINPTGAVVYANTKSPDAAWEFVKYLASPPAQTKLMELKASLPANKEVLAGPYGTSFDGPRSSPTPIAYAHIKPSFTGYNDFTTTLQTELDANVFMAPNKTAREAIDDRRCRSWTPSWPASDERRGWSAGTMTATGGRGEARRAAGRSEARGAGRSSSSPRRCSGSRILSAGPDHRDRRDQPDRMGSAPAAQFVGPGQLRELARDDRFLKALRNTAFYTVVSVPARDGHLALPRARTQSGRPRDRLDPDRLLPAGRHLDHRDRPGLALDLQPRGAGSSTSPSACSASRPRSGSATRSGDAVDHRDVHLAGPGGQHRSSSWPACRRSRPSCSTPPASTAPADGHASGTSSCRCSPRASSSPGSSSLIGAFQVFDQVFVLARPRPTEATITVVYFIYENGFKFFKMGYATAASWILFLIVAVLTAIYFRSQRPLGPLPVSAPERARPVAGRRDPRRGPVASAPAGRAHRPAHRRRHR